MAGKSEWDWPARLPTPEELKEKPVHDGDTLRLLIDRAFEDLSIRAIRLRNTYAPELGEPGGEETHQFVLGWLAWYGNSAGEWPYTLYTYRTKTSSREIKTFERYVGVLTSGTSVLNEEINIYVKRNGWGPGNTTKFID
jgi:hypothetical protein